MSQASCAHATTEDCLISNEADRVASQVSEDEYSYLLDKCYEIYGLHFDTKARFQFNIKCIISRRYFSFSEGLSRSSKTFMILHTLGHYYFITSAMRKGVKRYEYIYDTFAHANLHIYEAANDSGDGGLSGSQRLSDKVRIDRTVFEVGANNYAMHVLDYMGLTHLKALVRHFEPADIAYILDVTANGKTAIVDTDQMYLEKYVCNNCTIENYADNEGVYDPDLFNINDIDWMALARINLEIHFF